ncbi:MAG: N-glycosylase/DNA lyase [Methanotrichaceae archaeon]
MEFGKKEYKGIPELMELYAPVKGRIESRLNEFEQIWEMGSDEDLFRELVFCLLTPQSRAKTCWAAVERLVRKSLIDGCQPELIQDELIGVRFNERKAEYICLARKMFSDKSLRSIINGFSNPYATREWLVENVMGLGYKEASHFLRNIGLGDDLAILDRHILKNLKLMGVIDEIPKSLSKKTYLDIEKKMTEFSKQIRIPMSHLDLLLWYKEAGDVFK